MTMSKMQKIVFAELTIVVLLFGFSMVPTALFNEAMITNPIHDSLKENDPQLWYDSAIVEETEDQTIFHLEGDQYKARINAESYSKAQANGADPTVYKYVWGNGGDGHVSSSGDFWNYGASLASVTYSANPSDMYDAFFSFNLGTTLSDAKSIDSIVFEGEVGGEANEGAEVTRIKALNTLDKCGYGGGDDCNCAEYIARNSAWPCPRKSGETDTTTFNTAGWRYVGLPSAWIVPGDVGYLTLYFLALSGWESSPSDYIQFVTHESNSPYLTITYTAWSAPTANSADITNEPSELIPGQSYTVQTIVSDTDGRSNLKYAYLYISSDHTTYRVRFDWDIDAGTFTQGEGATYAMINTTACANETSGATGWKLTWGFNVTVDWQEGAMDWANSATDAQSKTTTNWNNENTWHTDRLWMHSITANWISEGVNLEDGDYILTSQSLNITGYVYWYQTTTAYDLGFGTPRAELVVDGTNQGDTYNCSLDSNGYYNISYTTPSSEDFDWSLDVELDNIPTGMTEAPSNDDGKSPLFLLLNPPPARFGLAGATFSVTVLPENYTWTHQARRELNDTQVFDVFSMDLPYAESNVSITVIPTTYTFSHIQMGYAQSTENNISSLGQYKLVNISASWIEVWFDTELTWHEVDFRPQLPDGLGENWDVFTWYMNTTRVTKNPQEFSHGTYALKVYDAFDQKIHEESVVILSTDDKSITYAPILPMHRVAIKNDDRESYYLNITRAVGGIITQQPLPPMGEVHFRVYGLVSYANYSITVCKTSDNSQVGEFTLSVPDHSVSAIVDYVTEESVDFVTVFPSSIEVDQIFSISGWVFWTNSTPITGFSAYADWGAGDVEITVSGQNFYGSHQYTSVATEIFTVTVEVSGQDNETRTYQTNVEPSTISDTPLIAIDLPTSGTVNELIPLFGSVHYASGEALTGSVYVHWGDSTVDTKTLSLGTFKSNHTYGKTGDFSVGVKYTLDSVGYWKNTTIGIWTVDPTEPGNLQLATDSTDPVSVYTINQLSGETVEYQTVSGSSINLDLDTSNFELLEQLETDGDIEFYDDFEDGDYTADPVWTEYLDGAVISSDSAYGEYSVKLDGDTIDGIYVTDQFTASSSNQYIVVTVKLEGIQSSSEATRVLLRNTGLVHVILVFTNNGREDFADTSAYDYEYFQQNEGEWVTWVINWYELWKGYYGSYPTSAMDVYVREADNTHNANAYGLIDNIAFMEDPSLLFASEYALHAFAQGESDYAMTELVDAWDFAEDVDGWTATHNEDLYMSDGNLVMTNSTVNWMNAQAVTSLSIDSTKYHHLRIRAKVNSTIDMYITVKDGEATIIGSIGNWDRVDQWQVFDLDLSLDADWSGIETGIQLWVNGILTAGATKFELDYALLLTCDPTDFTKYQSTVVDLLDGSQQITLFPKRQLTLDSGLPDTTRAIVTNAIGSSEEYAIGDSALSLDLVYNPFESYSTTFDDSAEEESWVESEAVYSITNGYVYQDGTGSDWPRFYYKDFKAEDGEVTVDLSVFVSQAGIVFRLQDLRNYYMFYLKESTDSWFLRKQVDGSGTTLVYGSLTVDMYVVYELKVRFYDEYIELYVDGVLVGSYSDSTFLSEGYAGFYSYQTGTVKFYDFSITELPDSRDYTILGLEEDTKDYFYDEWDSVADFDGDLDGWVGESEYDIGSTGLEARMEDDVGGAVLRVDYPNILIDASIYKYCKVRARANNTSTDIAIWFSNKHVGAVTSITASHAWYEWDLSDDADWTGTPTELELQYREPPFISWTDAVLLLTDEDYSYKSVQLDQDRVVILFAQGATYFSGTMPDGTGVRFENYNWYVDDTQIYDPLQSLNDGAHTYYVKDAFDQTIVSETSFTVYSTQSLNEVTASLPIYKVVFQSQDLVAYYLQVTKNAITKEYPLPPMGQTPDFWLYGHSTPITYTVTVKKVADDSNAGDPFTLSVPDNPVTRLINYVNEQTRVLAATIQVAGVVNEDVFVYGSLRWTNGTSATGTVTVYWGDETSDTPTITNGLFSVATQYASPAVYNISVNYSNQWVNGSCVVKLETGLDLAIETYWFDANTEKGLVSITVATNLGTALVNVLENEVTKLSAQAESTTLYYEMATTEGYYNVTVEVYKTGYTTQTLYSSYRVRAASLIMEEYSGVHWVSDTYVQVILHTNWGNCTVTITENSHGETKTFTPANEGTISWTGDHTQNYVNVTLVIDGGAQSLTWYDGYYYIKEKVPVSGAAAILRGLSAGDLILPSFLLLGGFFMIGRYNIARSRKEQARGAWNQNELQKRGATTEKDLHPYDRRKLQEAEEKEFGKRRNRRVPRQLRRKKN